MIWSTRVRTRLAVLVSVFALFIASGAAAFAVGVAPSEVTATLSPGESLDVDKTVTTPASAPKADVYFLADTTGSMGTAIANVKAAFSDILTTLTASGDDIAFGAGDYKDFPRDPYAFQNAAPIADDAGASATVAANAWVASGGFDGSEGQFFALHRIAAGDADFRSDAAKIVVWFGDAPGHDPICSAISGEDEDITEATVITDLMDAGIIVIAVSTPTGYPNALDDNPTTSAGDYLATCGAAGGTVGQASRITAATGGIYQSAPAASEVADTILAAIAALPIAVEPVATCDAGLSMSFSPESQTVEAGADALFTETITVAADAAPGELNCTVNWTLNGGSGGPDFTQTVTITVLGGDAGGECVDLVAGQHEVVGEVCVEDDGTDMTVTYSTIEGWDLVETHLHVACDGSASDIPQTRKGNPIPGKFDHSDSHGITSEYSYVIEDCTAGTIAAHAVVVSDAGRNETAWGDGTTFPGNNWGMWFEYPAPT